MMIKKNNSNPKVKQKQKQQKPLPSTARNVALSVLLATEQQEAYANLALNRFLSQVEFAPCDKNLTTQLVYGTLRYLGTIDFLLSGFIKKDFSAVEDYLRWILRMAVYQMFYLDKVPVHAIINEACEQAKVLGHQGQVNFVNGVLRNLDRNKDKITYPTWSEQAAIGKKYLQIMTSHPGWLVDYAWDLFGGEQCKAFLESNNQTPRFTCRVNTLKTSKADLMKQLQSLGISVEPCDYASDGIVLVTGGHGLEDIPAIPEGALQPQGESSMLAAQALSPAPGSMVLDLCAAPGGKTTHLAQLMKNEGTIIAQDVHEHKVKILERNCKRLGAEIVRPVLGDSCHLRETYYEQFDYCLADVPCTGLGILSHRPDIRWRKDIGNIQELAALAEKILDQGARALAPGGVMVFSTCTITREENIDQLEKFLARHGDFQLESMVDFFSQVTDDKLKNQLAKGWWQILPHVEGLDGFFIARLRKKG
ncbi:MAG: 16S rRNA (cytosine(967)-C(5))-methyltransferase RsmB [Peptococcaceae bacterium]|nr:16S rRNA (cytosine(967)-C(5))-methyltransferase RsmB [Peptococcaceae bacterium]